MRASDAGKSFGNSGNFNSHCAYGSQTDYHWNRIGYFEVL